MARRFPAAILLFALAGQVNAAPAFGQARQAGIEDEEYAVYSAVVTEIGARERVGAALIWHHTFSKGVPSSAQTDEFVADLVEDFNRRNDRPYPLGNNLKSARPYRLVSEESMKGMVSLPAPIISLSRAGFNGAKDRALVYVSYGRGAVYRREHYVVLHKEKSGWRVARKLAVFVPLRPV